MISNSKWPRFLVVTASLLLAGAWFFPLWQIQLNAPQYPEGLLLLINANGLAGDVDVVNGLNHYIGMQTLHTEDFIEFAMLPYLIGFFVLFGLIVALVNNKKIYYAFIALFLLFAIVSMVDFYRWEYNYGHNLDLEAPIRVPGMSYQPPLIGYKQLLNFGAYSIPDIGGWLFIAAGILLVLTWIILLRPKWITKKSHVVAMAVVIMVSVSACASGPQPINYGKDPCDYCKMTIMDKKYGCETVTDKGKVYRFDDLHCLVTFLKNRKGSTTAYINDFNGKGFLDASNMFFVKAEQLKTPMGGQVAAFANKRDADNFLQSNNGTNFTWSEIKTELQK